MPLIEVGKKRSALECVCKGKVFTLVVSPNVDGSAQVSELHCLTCSRGVLLTDGRIGTKNPHNGASVEVDNEGREHHSLKAETLELGADSSELNN